MLYPVCCLHSYVTDIEILTLEALKRIYFAPKTDEDVKQLLCEYKQLHKFDCEMAVEFRKEDSVHSEFIICLFEQFLLKNKESAKTLFIFLSFVVCLPAWEAIVEIWGSSVDHHFKIKPNTKEGFELENTGTVDKFAFIRINGPSPGSSLKRKFYKSAWALMFKGDYIFHFFTYR